MHLIGSFQVFASDNLVRPVVAIVQAPGQSWIPDPVEVEEVIELPLEGRPDDFTGIHFKA